MQCPEERPAWMIRQENGALAEARTRAFLLDRFWVLERSVDIEGADFIVQRRLTNRSLLDREPPRLGFIQSKYYSQPSTTQYVHREYVVDPDDQPRNEFFLVCHIGTEDSTRLFLLSASDICTCFSVTEEDHSKPSRYALPGQDTLVQRFEVIDRGSALRRIELALRNADFLGNRRFLSWALPSRTESGPIDPMYYEPIDNWWGDIPSGFEELRKKARDGRWELEEVVKKLRLIEEATDPEKALTVAEEIKVDWGDQVVLLKELFDEDFWGAVQYHRRRHRELDEAGLLSAYESLHRTAFKAVVDNLAPQMPLPADRVFVLCTHYDPDTFLNTRHEIRIEACGALWPEPPPDGSWHDKDIPGTKGILSSMSGRVEAFLVAGRCGYKDLNKEGEWVDTPGPWTERIKGVVESIVGQLLEHILIIRFGE